MAFEPFNYTEVDSASPTGRSSATLVMLGLGAVVTPQTTGRVLVIATGNVSAGTATDGFSFRLYTGTGGAPTNNTAVTGTALGSLQSVPALAAGSLTQGFAIAAVATGLSVPSTTGTGKAQSAATPCWFDIAFEYTTGANTVTFTNVSIIAIEI